MKVVILDIDGVLNNQKWERDVMNKYSVGTDFIFNQDAMFLLKQLVEVTGARIVISSSWRISEFSRDLIMDNFWPYRLSVYSWTGQEAGTRGHQIAEWLERHSYVTNYVAFDDDEDLEELGDHFIKVTTWDGLRADHVQRAMNILTEDRDNESNE